MAKEVQFQHYVISVILLSHSKIDLIVDLASN